MMRIAKNQSTDLLCGFVFLGLFTMGMWMELDRIGIFSWVLLALSLFLFMTLGSTLSLKTPSLHWPSRPRTWGPALVITALVFAPIALYTGATLSSEFPFNGDHTHHLRGANEGVWFWKRHFFYLLFFIPAFKVWGFKTLGRFWPLVLLTLLILWSYLGVTSEFFARYPAADYLVTFPLNWVAQIFHWKSQLDASRITHALGVLVWLWILRPLALGKWPGVSVLPVALYLFYQKDFIYYFGSAYIEPWSILFLLIAIEHALLAPPEERWKSLFWVGVSSFFKEQAILVLPFFSLSLIQRKNLKKSIFQSALVSWSAALPFVIYYLFRMRVNNWRSVGIGTSDLLNPDRIQVFAQRTLEQFLPLGLIASGLILFYLIWSSLKKGPYREWALLLLCAAGFQFLFFYFDAQSIPWTGYTRFYLSAWVLIAGILFTLKTKRVQLVCGALLILSSTPALARFFEAAFDYAPARNYLEHTDAAIHFPIQSLIEQAEGNPEFEKITEVLVNNPREFQVFSRLDELYPRITSHINLLTPEGTYQNPICACTENHQAILFPTHIYSGILKGTQRSPHRLQQEKLCAEQLSRTCSIVVEQFLNSGEWIGSIGFGKKPAHQ